MKCLYLNQFFTSGNFAKAFACPQKNPTKKVGLDGLNQSSNTNAITPKQILLFRRWQQMHWHHAWQCQPRYGGQFQCLIFSIH